MFGGVLTVLNNEIQCGRDVTKASTFRVETFRPNELGFLGYADSDGKVVFYRAPLRRHTVDTPFVVDDMTGLPRVDIVYSYAGADGRGNRYTVGRRQAFDRWKIVVGSCHGVSSL